MVAQNIAAARLTISDPGIWTTAIEEVALDYMKRLSIAALPSNRVGSEWRQSAGVLLARWLRSDLSSSSTSLRAASTCMPGRDLRPVALLVRDGKAIIVISPTFRKCSLCQPDYRDAPGRHAGELSA
jgi:hypothetical protein